jgi:hypothetical protein
VNHKKKKLRYSIKCAMCSFFRLFSADGKLTVNGVELIKGDTPLPKGNIMFLPDVLFVTATIVKNLQEKNKDKETPPPLTYPWKGSKFLSHAFLILERTPGFRHITRFLNMADLADYVPGAGK